MVHVERAVRVGHVVDVEVDRRQHADEAVDARPPRWPPARPRRGGSRRRRRARRAGTTGAAWRGAGGGRPRSGSTTTADAVRWSGSDARSSGSAAASHRASTRARTASRSAGRAAASTWWRARARSPGRLRRPRRPRPRGASRRVGGDPAASPGATRHVGVAGDVPAPREVGAGGEADAGAGGRDDRRRRRRRRPARTPRSPRTTSAPSNDPSIPRAWQSRAGPEVRSRSRRARGRAARIASIPAVGAAPRSRTAPAVPVGPAHHVGAPVHPVGEVHVEVPGGPEHGPDARGLAAEGVAAGVVGPAVRLDLDQAGRPARRAPAPCRAARGRPPGGRGRRRPAARARRRGTTQVRRRCPSSPTRPTRGPAPGTRPGRPVRPGRPGRGPARPPRPRCGPPPTRPTASARAGPVPVGGGQLAALGGQPVEGDLGRGGLVAADAGRDLGAVEGDDVGAGRGQQRHQLPGIDVLRREAAPHDVVRRTHQLDPRAAQVGVGHPGREEHALAGLQPAEPEQGGRRRGGVAGVDRRQRRDPPRPGRSARRPSPRSAGADGRRRASPARSSAGAVSSRTSAARASGSCSTSPARSSAARWSRARSTAAASGAGPQPGQDPRRLQRHQHLGLGVRVAVRAGRVVERPPRRLLAGEALPSLLGGGVELDAERLADGEHLEEEREPGAEAGDDLGPEQARRIGRRPRRRGSDRRPAGTGRPGGRRPRARPRGRRREGCRPTGPARRAHPTRRAGRCWRGRARRASLRPRPRRPRDPTRTGPSVPVPGASVPSAA